jgi:hypothetical protein
MTLSIQARSAAGARGSPAYGIEHIETVGLKIDKLGRVPDAGYSSDAGVRAHAADEMAALLVGLAASPAQGPQG